MWPWGWFLPISNTSKSILCFQLFDFSNIFLHCIFFARTYRKVNMMKVKTNLFEIITFHIQMLLLVMCALDLAFLRRPTIPFSLACEVKHTRTSCGNKTQANVIKSSSENQSSFFERQKTTCKTHIGARFRVKVMYNVWQGDPILSRKGRCVQYMGFHYNSLTDY